MKKKYGDKAQISGAAAAAWDGIFILAHALRNAKSTSGSDVIAALLNARSSGPRGDLAFKNRHYVALTTYVVAGAEGRQHEARREAAAHHADPGERRPASRLPAAEELVG